MKLWLARHATPLVDAGICYGRRDVAADAAATAECAQVLAQLLPAGIRVSHSPLGRCAQLAQALSERRPDLACTSDPRLQEMDFGAWEGRAWQDIGPAELQAWTDGFAHHTVGGTGESTMQVMARVASAFDELQGPGDALWITHAGVIRAAELIARGQRQITSANQWPINAPAYGQWCTLELA
ncbi:alpha-ribazole phosphatase [Polaromonas sp. YR568]|uniref:histidine phosphatase family protein n=1 Tax=Polaromonas sp. YR568 TaxID=1855301 RepID=UPI0008EDFEAD|nr:histidine phosphatase family protein [Polaromonas sp. YR568]SFU65717.1 alpha-ribazole phosphatase [Polaromonas sp. YR568]